MKENIFLKFPSNNFKFPVKKDLKENRSLINSHSQKIMNPIDTSINEDNQKKIKLTNTSLNNNEQNKKKLENLLNLINNSIEFKNNEILDFKSFILTVCIIIILKLIFKNHKKYHELLEELKINEENLEKEQIKSIKLEKNLEISSKPIFNQINQNKIDENLSEKLEKKYTLLNEEVNKKIKNNLNKVFSLKI